MTAQAMTLSLEQQTQQRQRQARATPAVAPKPKKLPGPQKEPEPELEPEPKLEPEPVPEPVGACLRVMSGGQAEGRPGMGHRLQACRAERPRVRLGGKMQKMCHRTPVPGIQGAHCESADVTDSRSLTSPSCQHTSEEAPLDKDRPKSFQQKRDYFQKMGEGTWGGERTQTLGPCPGLARGSGVHLLPWVCVACPGAWMGRPGGR